MVVETDLSDDRIKNTLKECRNISEVENSGTFLMHGNWCILKRYNDIGNKKTGPDYPALFFFCQRLRSLSRLSSSASRLLEQITYSNIMRQTGIVTIVVTNGYRHNANIQKPPQISAKRQNNE